jgi:acyl carrier protein
MTVAVYHKDIGEDDFLKAILSALKDFDTHPDADLSEQSANVTTVADLALDSLDLLEFAMSVEERLGIELDIVDLPATLTLLDVARRFGTSNSQRMTK